MITCIYSYICMYPFILYKDLMFPQLLTFPTLT